MRFVRQIGSDRRRVHDMTASGGRRTFGLRKETRRELRRTGIIDMAKTHRAQSRRKVRAVSK